MFTVGYTATDPAVAARVTNTLAALFSEENRRLREQSAVGATEFFETQLKELRTRLAGQEQRITAYKEQHLGELPEQREVNVRALERLQQTALAVGAHLGGDVEERRRTQRLVLDAQVVQLLARVGRGVHCSPLS